MPKWNSKLRNYKTCMYKNACIHAFCIIVIFAKNVQTIDIISDCHSYSRNRPITIPPNPIDNTMTGQSGS